MQNLLDQSHKQNDENLEKNLELENGKYGNLFRFVHENDISYSELLKAMNEAVWKN